MRFFCASWKVHAPSCKFLLASIDRSRVETWQGLPQTCGKAMGQHVTGASLLPGVPGPRFLDSKHQVFAC